jgi:hypothetical protein
MEFNFQLFPGDGCREIPLPVAGEARCHYSSKTQGGEATLIEDRAVQQFFTIKQQRGEEVCVYSRVG